jgi:hypothetical protein
VLSYEGALLNVDGPGHLDLAEAFARTLLLLDILEREASRPPWARRVTM